MTRAFVGLGANVGDRAASLAAAVAALGQLDGATVVAVSSVRETEPWGPVSQPDYLNQVIVVETAVSPGDLLLELLEIERTLGRDRAAEVRYGPRTIDLDLLVYGEETVSEPGLELPHPRIAERLFVLEPLAELEAGLLVPGQGIAAELLEQLRASPPTQPLD